MYKEIIEHLKNLFLLYKPVYTFKYQDKQYNNQQNNYKGYQVYVDDTSYSRLNITTNIFIFQLNIWILSQPDKSTDGILNVQDTAYSIANSVINRLDTTGLTVYDYDITTVSHVTDDDSAGVRLTIQLQVPLSGLCPEDEWREEPISQKEDDKEIKVKDRVDKDININPIKLERIPKC